MLNIMRADLYRIFHSKGIYITMAIYFITLFLQLFTNGTIGVGTGVMTEGDVYRFISLSGMSTFNEAGEMLVTGKVAPFLIMADASTMFYFLLALIVFVAASDFSAGTVKNALSSGISRNQYYLAKLLLASTFCFVLQAIQIVVPLVLGTIVNGFGGEFTGAYLASLLKSCLSQLFLFLAATCVGIFLVFVTKRTAAVNGLYLAWLLAPILVVFMLMEGVSPDFSKLLNYDMTVNIQLLSLFDGLSAEIVRRAFAIGAFYIAASTVGGLLLFRKSEIK